MTIRQILHRDRGFAPGPAPASPAATPAELLEALAELWEDTLMPALPPGPKHARGSERTWLASSVGRSNSARARRERELPAAVPEGDDDALWQALPEVVRADLAVAEPGYAS